MTDIPGGRTPHVDPDVLADLQEGLLDGPAADAATAHLAGCVACRADLAALDEVRDRLAGAPDVGPVPADLVDRLDQALAGAGAEPALTANQTVVPLRAAAAKGPRGMRVLQIAAVLVLVLAGGAIGVSALNNSGGSNSDSATSAEAGGDASAGAADEATFPVTATGRDWTAATLQEAAPALASGAITPAALGRLTAPSAPDKDSSASGNDDRSRQLADAPAARLAGGPALADCATELAGEPVAPVAVDLASYEGQPAAVVLLPTPDDPSTVDVFVVKPECPPGEFLYFVRVPRS